jgi:predicted house-cleaning NTP pyrophosphatase (Maf/HAM1 superfamily)
MRLILASGSPRRRKLLAAAVTVRTGQVTKSATAQVMRAELPAHGKRMP